MNFFGCHQIGFLCLLLAAGVPTNAAAIDVVEIPAGEFWVGSSPEEREMAYQLDEAAYGHSKTRTRRWYENERPPRKIFLPQYWISRTLITNAQYSVFVKATGYSPPDVTSPTWKNYGLIHPYSRTRRHAWTADGQYPASRGNHPVVLVSLNDALAYAHWLSDTTGKSWRLPTEEEWEKAARGTDGRYFSWGNSYDPQRLNSHDQGPFDTTDVDAHPDGVSPYGMLDSAGQVFEWTASTYTDGRYVVKGGSWDDKGCGICRPAARHTRPHNLKHILIGFRLVRRAP
jgi:toxoflavin biosynthesis protein ToxD